MPESRQHIINPILRGFNPDPSIIRVGEDYYIATSTFEWFPGVQIHHSKDLVNWKLVSRVLTRSAQLDMLGVPDSCGVWAPCLSYDKGVFYLVYSNVKSFDGTWKDTPNYLVTTTDIEGEWSDPIFLNASGFDGSLFHDEDGTKWYVSMLVDHRKGKFFGGIILQQYDEKAKKLVGQQKHIYSGTPLGLTEGPHIYQKDGFYYYALAEGGTEYDHAFSVIRSRNIDGPFEISPYHPMVSSKDNPDLPLQKAGHGDFVQTQNGDWYCVFLVGRPLTKRGRCITGRETAIQPIVWPEGDWPRLASGGCEPQLEVKSPGLPLQERQEKGHFEDFDEQELSIHFQSLRLPFSNDWCSLNERPGFLRMSGRESLSSFHRQSMVARRVQEHRITASTCIEFEPASFQQMAGLVCYYNTSHFYYFYLTTNDSGDRKLLDLISCDKFKMSEPLKAAIDVTGEQRVYLKAEIAGADLQFSYGVKEGEWEKVGPVLDASILSDDYVQYENERYRPAFTGAFVGMCCQDLTGNGGYADFDWFKYEEQ